MRNKKTNVKSTLFPPAGSTSLSFQTPLPIPMWHEGMGVVVSTRWVFCPPLLPSHSSTPLQHGLWIPQPTIPVKEKLLQHGHCIGWIPSGIHYSGMDAPRASGKNVPWYLEHLFLPCCFSLLFFFMLLNAFSQRYQPGGLSSECGGSIAKRLHQAGDSPWPRPTEDTLEVSRACYQNLATNIQH